VTEGAGRGVVLDRRGRQVVGAVLGHFRDAADLAHLQEDVGRGRTTGVVAVAGRDGQRVGLLGSRIGAVVDVEAARVVRGDGMGTGTEASDRCEGQVGTVVHVLCSGN
jgi:hypothetical protein